MSDRVGLGITTEPKTTFKSYFVGENADVLSRVHSAQRLWLYGQTAVGKTHVLEALLNEFPSARLLRGKTHSLETMTQNTLTLIDDIDCMVGKEKNEYTLFAGFEATDFSTSRWVVTASNPPQSLQFLYPDLASRMGTFECVELLPVSATELPLLLKFWAENRDVQITSDVVQFLIDRIPRTQQNLWQLFKKIDRAALLENREITIPLVRKVLNLDG